MFNRVVLFHTIHDSTMHHSDINIKARWNDPDKICQAWKHYSVE